MNITQHFTGGPLDGTTREIESKRFADKLDGEGNRTGVSIKEAPAYLLNIADTSPEGHHAHYSWYEQVLDS